MQGEVSLRSVRYVNHLDPTVSKGSWSDAELDILYSKFNEYGNKWFLLQKHLPGRYVLLTQNPDQYQKLILRKHPVPPQNRYKVGLKHQGRIY